MSDKAHARWMRFRTAVAQEALPCALVDLEALEANARELARPLRASGRTLRLATKSLRCPDLVRRVREVVGAQARGLMTYTASETAFWADHGERDLLLAYPTALKEDANRIARANAGGATAATAIDCVEHVDLLAAAACECRTTIPLIIDVDVAWRPVGARLHVGVHRSPIRDASDVVALARRVARTDGVRFHGVMAYEAQIAGVPDRSTAVRAMKAASRRDVARKRTEIAKALTAAGLPTRVFNGGGTGSLASSVRDEVLTEVTVGSGFLDSHLFDDFSDLSLQPAAFFALQVARRPNDRMVVCHGGGFVASGAHGRDRLPRPSLPEGLSLLPLEGAGEVQTPLEISDGSDASVLALGDAVFFRHAKAGELAEHFVEYLLVRGSNLEGRAPTYRGLGHCFLG